MKIIRSMELGRKIVFAHKIRSLLIAATISILFGIIIVGIFLIQGSLNLIFSQIKTDKKIDGNVFAFEIDPITVGGYKNNDTVTRKQADDLAKKDAKKYGGVYDGGIVEYSNDNGKVVGLVDPKIFRGSGLNNSAIEDGKIASIGILNDTFSELDSNLFSEIEKMPGYVSIKTMKNANKASVMNYFIPGTVPSSISVPLAIDNEDIVKKLSENGYYFLQYRPIIVFDDLDKAIQYKKAMLCGADTKCSNDIHGIVSFMNVMPEVSVSYDDVYRGFNIFAVVLAILAIIVAITTLIRVILSERSTIALYRSLGASGIDIFMIYFFYLLELCIISVILATAIGFVGALIISNNHEKYILDSLELGFGYRIPERPMIGLNWRYFVLAGIMLLIAPICTLLSTPAFSAKNTAKKMKE